MLCFIIYRRFRSIQTIYPSISYSYPFWRSTPNQKMILSKLVNTRMIVGYGLFGSSTLMRMASFNDKHYKSHSKDRYNDNIQCGSVTSIQLTTGRILKFRETMAGTWSRKEPMEYEILCIYPLCKSLAVLNNESTRVQCLFSNGRANREDVGVAKQIASIS